ncbi:MAG: hypothetical protein GY795_35500 [Desulfobacterales bacterium]|nr:hypothetical protein [Desulfobacterales bacterium]
MDFDEFFFVFPLLDDLFSISVTKIAQKNLFGLRILRMKKKIGRRMPTGPTSSLSRTDFLQADLSRPL